MPASWPTGLALPHARNEASHRHSCPRGGRAGARLDCLPGEGGSAGRLRGKGVELVCSAAPVAGKRDAGAYRRGRGLGGGTAGFETVGA